MCFIIQNSATVWQLADVLASPKVVAALTGKVQVRNVLWNKGPLQLKWYLKKKKWLIEQISMKEK